MVAPIEVTDPYDQSAKILVMRSLRDDPLGRMHDRKQIDEAQYRAGDQWRDYYAIIEVGGAQAIDPSKDAVDGGYFRDNRDSDRYSRAFNEMRRASTAAGMLGEQSLKDVLANRLFLNQVAALRNISAETASERFKTALEAIAILWGFAVECPITKRSCAKTCKAMGTICRG